MRRTAWVILACSGLAACGSCSRRETGGGDAPAASGAAANGVVAEALPRCRGGTPGVAIPGEDVVVGDVAVGEGALYAGVVRLEGGKRVASVMRLSLDLASSRTIDIGVPFGDDPPPSPRVHGTSVYVAYFGRHATDAGPRVRQLDVARLDEGGLGKIEAAVVQQADESTAFDVAWSDSGAGLVAWDEDAPHASDAGSAASASSEVRGFVKVQAIGSGARRVASPETSDAESPRLLARPGGGFWLGWLARRAEEEPYAVEGPGEKRAFRWVEVVPLTATGEAAGPVRRVSSEKGRAASFELARAGEDLVVMVQDEASPSEGGGARIVRHVVGRAGGEPTKIDTTDLVDGGVGATVAELVPVAGSSGDGGVRWLAWTDPAEHIHLAPLAEGSLLASARSTSEPAFDGARVLAAAPPDSVYALVFAAPTTEPGARREGLRPEVRRFTCEKGSRALPPRPPFD